MSKLCEIKAFDALVGPSSWKTWVTANKEYYALHGVDELVASLTLKDVPVGIEVEVENIPQVEGWDKTFWALKEDHSLRNHGYEFVSRPLTGEQIVYALLNLEGAIPPTASFSQRTSVHIHVNVRDLTPEEVSKILLVYLTVEKLLYRFVGHNRDKNIFCVPLQTLDWIYPLYSSLKTLGRTIPHQTENQRYSGLNFDPVLKFGTIEYRQMHGTKSSIRLLTWINMLLAIRKYAVETPTEVLIQEILSLNTNSEYRIYAMKVFGNTFPVLDSPELNADIEQGVLVVKRSLFSQKFLTKLKREKSVESPLFEVYGLIFKQPAVPEVTTRIRTDDAVNFGQFARGVRAAADDVVVGNQALVNNAGQWLDAPIAPPRRRG